MLPFALLIVVGIHRLNGNRWPLVTAALATVLAAAVSGLADEFVVPIFWYSNQMLEAIGVDRFEFMLMPKLLVCFVGGMVLAWLCRRRMPTEAFA